MRKYLNLRTNIAQGLILAFLLNTFGPIPSAQADEFRLPAPGVMVHLSPEFNPPILKGLKVHPDNPFRFDFILDQGDLKNYNASETTKLIKYFLASLTIPEKDLWVNLSPYEKNRIIPNSFGLTEMGRDLLAEDYMLKQITASLIYPEGEVGRKFWKRIYEEAYKKFGTTNIPVNTFNKVWIIPDKAVVYENTKAGTAYVVESKLKVLLEQDYLALEKNQHQPNTLVSQTIREIVIPELTKEVNEDKNFSQLRQVYNSLILAAWYKKKIKDSILAQVYEDKKKVAGVEGIHDIGAIYQRYLQAFKKGVYSYIKEDIDLVTQQAMPRKYFSGGVNFFGDLAMSTTVDAAMLPIFSDRAVIVRSDFAMAEPSPKDLNKEIQEWINGGQKEISLTASDGTVFKFMHQHEKVPNGSRHQIDVILDYKKIGYIHFEITRNQKEMQASMHLGFPLHARTDRFENISDAIFVDPQATSAHQGNFRGIGRSLLGLAERLAYLQGARRFYAAGVEWSNFENFYRGLSYHDAELTPYFDSPPTIVLVKDLNESSFSRIAIERTGSPAQVVPGPETNMDRAMVSDFIKLASSVSITRLKASVRLGNYKGNIQEWGSNILGNFIDPVGITSARIEFESKKKTGGFDPQQSRRNARSATLFSFYMKFPFTTHGPASAEQFYHWVAERIEQETQLWLKANQLEIGSPEVSEGTEWEKDLIKKYRLGHEAYRVPEQFAFLENIRLFLLAKRMGAQKEIELSDLHHWIWLSIDKIVPRDMLSPIASQVFFLADRAMKSDRSSVLVTGSHEARPFLIGRYRLREDVELDAGEPREGFIYGIERLSAKRVGVYHLDVFYFPKAVKLSSIKNAVHQGNILLVKKGDGWEMDDFHPYSFQNSETYKRFGQSGAAEAVVSYISKSVRQSGKQLFVSDDAEWSALRFFLSGRAVWPAEMRMVRSKDFNKWTKISDPLVAQRFFDKGNISKLMALTSKNKIIILKLKALGKGKYRVSSVKFLKGSKGNLSFEEGDKVNVDFPSGRVSFKKEEAASVFGVGEGIYFRGFADQAMTIVDYRAMVYTPRLITMNTTFDIKDPRKNLTDDDLGILDNWGAGLSEISFALSNPFRTQGEPFGLFRRFNDNTVDIKQDILIQKDFERTIQNRLRSKQRSITIYQIGLGERSVETRNILGVLKEAFEKKGISLEAQRDWVVNFIAVDVDSGIVQKFHINFNIETSFHLNLYIVQADTLDQEAMEKLGTMMPKADYVFHRHTTYANHHISLGKFHAGTSLKNNSELTGLILNAYISTKNVLKYLSKRGARYILEAAQRNPQGRVFHLPGAAIMKVSDYMDQQVQNPNALENIGTGIYKIEDPLAVEKGGIKSIVSDGSMSAGRVQPADRAMVEAGALKLAKILNLPEDSQELRYVLSRFPNNWKEAVSMIGEKILDRSRRPLIDRLVERGFAPWFIADVVNYRSSSYTDVIFEDYPAEFQDFILNNGGSKSGVSRLDFDGLFIWFFKTRLHAKRDLLGIHFDDFKRRFDHFPPYFMKAVAVGDRLPVNLSDKRIIQAFIENRDRGLKDFYQPAYVGFNIIPKQVSYQTIDLSDHLPDIWEVRLTDAYKDGTQQFNLVLKDQGSLKELPPSLKMWLVNGGLIAASVNYEVKEEGVVEVKLLQAYLSFDTRQQQLKEKFGPLDKLVLDLFERYIVQRQIGHIILAPTGSTLFLNTAHKMHRNSIIRYNDLFSQDGYDLDQIAYWKKELPWHSVTDANPGIDFGNLAHDHRLLRLEQLGDGALQLNRRIISDHTHWGFILENPFLNDKSLWDGARSGQTLEDLQLKRQAERSYFEQLKKNVPEIYRFSQWILDQPEYHGKKIIVLGKSADPIYDALTVLTHIDGSYVQRQRDVSLIDFSGTLLSKELEDIDIYGDYLRGQLRRLGVNEDFDNVVFVNEVSHEANVTSRFLRHLIGRRFDLIVGFKWEDYETKQGISYDGKGSGWEWADWLDTQYNSGRQYRINIKEKSASNEYFINDLSQRWLNQEIIYLGAIENEDLQGIGEKANSAQLAPTDRAQIVENPVYYREAERQRILRLAKVRMVRGFWDDKKMVVHSIWAALDTIPGFHQARLESNFKLMKQLYLDNVKNYISKNGGQGGSAAFFQEVGGLAGFMNLSRNKFLDKRSSPAALLRLAIPGLIDLRNKDALDPLDVETNYWIYPENARYHILQALFTIDGFEEAWKVGDIKTMKGLYLKEVKDYPGGQYVFFVKVGGLRYLMSHFFPYLAREISRQQLIDGGFAKIFDVEGILDDISPTQVRLRKDPKLFEKELQKLFPDEIGSLMAILRHSYKIESPIALLQFAVPDLIDVRNKDALDPLDVELSYWTEPENALYHIYLALDSIEGFKEARESNDLEKMAELYRANVIGYHSKGDDKRRGQIAFFYEVGGLNTLMTNPRLYLDNKTGSPAAVLRFALPGLIDDSRYPVTLRSSEVEKASKAMMTENKLAEMGIEAFDLGHGFNRGTDKVNIQEQGKVLKVSVATNGAAVGIEKDNFIEMSTAGVKTCTAIAIKAEDANKRTILALAHIKQVHPGISPAVSYEMLKALIEHLKEKYDVTDIRLAVLYDPSDLAKTFMPSQQDLEKDLKVKVIYHTRRKGLESGLVADLFYTPIVGMNAQELKFIHINHSKTKMEVDHFDWDGNPKESDHAMKANGPGGIDLTPAHMNVEVKKDNTSSSALNGSSGGIKFHLDPAMLAQLQNAPGFVPVIISVEPVKNLREFLGV